MQVILPPGQQTIEFPDDIEVVRCGRYQLFGTQVTFGRNRGREMVDKSIERMSSL